MCCKLTAVQTQLYKHLVKSNVARRLLQNQPRGVSASSLGFITNLKKLCNRKFTIIQSCAQSGEMFNYFTLYLPDNTHLQGLLDDLTLTVCLSLVGWHWMPEFQTCCLE